MNQMQRKQEFAFQWHITDDCDQRCKHCYIFAEDGSKHVDTMDWNQLVATWNNIQDFCNTFNRIPHPYITGGDPILHPDFWRLLDLLKAEGVTFTLMGNPFHITDEVCVRMKDVGCRKYQLSLDGMRTTHDWMRMPGSFDATLGAVDIINTSGMKSVVMSTISSVNMNELVDIIDTVATHNVNIFAWGRYVPTADDKDTGIAPQEFRALLDACYKRYDYWKAQGCRTYFNKKDHLFKLYEWEEGLWQIPSGAVEGKMYGGCHCGLCHITIAPTGEVQACRRVPESPVGNVFEQRLADIWVDAMKDYRHYDQFEKCASCEIEPWCRGCPAVAKATSGSFYAPDPQCWRGVEPTL